MSEVIQKRKPGRPRKSEVVAQNASAEQPAETVMAALNLKNLYGNTIIPYETQFKPNGDLKGFNLQTILMNVQTNIYKIYELMAYYVQSDNIFSSAVKNVLTPFSVTPFRLQGSSQKAKDFFYNYFEEIGLNDLLYGIYYDLYLYGNVYLYKYENGYIQILPPHRIEIQDVKVPNEPVLGYKIPEAKSVNYSQVSETFIKTMEAKYSNGYPPEILEGIKKGQRIVQLNPLNTYTIQGAKSFWEKYSMPLGISLLPLFSKKNLISESENNELNVLQKSVLHIQVGDAEKRPKPNRAELDAVAQSFIQATTGLGISVTSWDVKAEWKKIDFKDAGNSIKMKYSEVNAAILSGLGLASVIVTGDATGSSFAAAQVNTSIASKRIMQNILNVQQFLRKIMKEVASGQRISDTRMPDLIFEPVDLQTTAEATDEILKLFEKGLVGNRTVLETAKLDYQQERDRKEQEQKDGDEIVFTLPPSFNNQTGDPNAPGAPTLPNSKRTSDPSKSASGKQPKPSTAQII